MINEIETINKKAVVWLIGIIFWILLLVSIIGTSSDPTAYPISSATYKEMDAEVGCGSDYSNGKKADIFNSRYKNHWMTWRGEVGLSYSDDASINLDGKGTRNLYVAFTDEKAGYDLTVGDFITVKFVMKSAGGCVLPFSGDYASIQ